MAKDTQPVELMGSNVREVIFADKIQLRNAVSNYFPANSTNVVTGMGGAVVLPNTNRTTIHISSTLDQAVVVKALLTTKTGGTDARYTAGLPSAGVTIAAGAKKRITATDIPELNTPFTRLVVELLPSVAPTAGDILVIAEVSI